MNLLDALSVALRMVWTNRLRSALTMLGMIIGVSSVIILVAVGQGADHLTIFANVRDQHDRGMLFAEAAAGAHFRRLPKGVREANVGILVQILVAKENHKIFVPDIQQYLLCGLIDGLAEVDAADLCADSWRKRANLEAFGD